MEPFHQRNKFLIYLTCFSSVYLKSIEKLTSNQRVIFLFKSWRVIALLLIQIHMASDIKFVIFDEAPGRIKQGVIRRNMAFLSFTLKSIFFFIKENEIDNLFQLWDSSFKEDFYTHKRKKIFDKIHRQTLRIVKLSFCLMALPSLTYGLPPFFSKSKKLSHPTGFPYQEQSPDYEALIIYDFVRVVCGLCLSAAADCTIIVLLSLQRAQLEFLYHSLEDMIESLSVDDDGNILVRQFILNEDHNKKIDEKNKWLKIFKKKNTKGQFEKTEKRIYINISKSNECFLYKRTVEEFEKKLKIWILHHQEAIRFFERIKILFTPLASMQMVYVVFYTCFTAFQLVAFKTSLSEALTIPIVALSNLISLFVWSKICDNFDPSISGLFGGAFGKHWFLYPRKIRNAFYFISMRCKKQLIIYGLSLFPLTSVTFFEIIKLAYQLFAFIMQVHHKNEIQAQKK